MFDPYIDPKDQVPVCRDESLVCSKVEDIVQSSQGLCEYLGFHVMNPTLAGVDDEL
jgi:hypothetical protein